MLTKTLTITASDETIDILVQIIEHVANQFDEAFDVHVRDNEDIDDD